MREHGTWRYEHNFGCWNLTSEQEAMLVIFGFKYIDEIKFLRHDRDLIFSLVERWWPGRNTFQMPFGEITITLADVANIVGLPITGEPIIFDESFSSDAVIMEYLGVEPPKVKGKSLVTFSWLRRNFMHLDRIEDDEEVSVDENRVISCTRAYLLGLISAVVFSDSSDMVNLRYLPFLEDLTTPTRHAWGASMLAYLYNSMSDFVRVLPEDKIMKNLNGCMTLIQVWCYEHFYIGRPVTGINSSADIFPVALRWTTAVVDPAHSVHTSASIYRSEFDTLKYTEVTWVPYMHYQYAPEIQRTAESLSLHRFYIIYHGDCMFHPADRVLRQFGMKQIIPDDPPCLNRGRASAAVRARKMLPGWNNRFQTHGVAHLSQPIDDVEDVRGSNAYRSWWGAPRISNKFYFCEEPRFQPRAIDDSSMREFYEHMIEMAPSIKQAIENPNPEISRAKLNEIWDYMQAGPTPPNPSLHIPPDYPVGIVRRRHARPRRNRHNVTQPQVLPDSPPQQDDEGTSQWGGEGTSQWAGQGTSQWGGEGTSQWAGQGTSQWGGEGSSQWGGEPPYQWGGVKTSQLFAQGTSQWGGEGTSQWGSEPTSQWGGQETSQWDNIFAPSHLTYTQLMTTPSAPIPSQLDDTQEEGGDVPPENTVERRGRLNLREVERRNYRRDARGDR